MSKIIKDTNMVPVTITDLTLESTISEGRTNPPTTDAVARAIAGGSGNYIESETINNAELVNALPAEPVSTTLYLIPEA